MTSDKEPYKNGTDRHAANRADGSASWTDGLKQLYDSVVDEPLPDAFKDLLAQFDDTEGGTGKRSASDSGKSS